MRGVEGRPKTAAVGVERRNALGREMTEVELKGPRTGLNVRHKVETGPEKGR